MTNPALAVSTPHGRFYQSPSSGKQVPSITNIISTLDKPALKWWAAKQAATYAAENRQMLAGLKTDQEVIDLVKGAPFRTTGEAAGVGDKVHDWIDGYAKHYIETGERGWEPEDLNDTPNSEGGLTIRRMWRQFVYLDSHYKIHWLVSEFTIWSDRHDYAGTGDWIAKIGNSVVYGDTKTGKGVYPEVGLQVAAGAGADYALDGDGNKYQLPKAERFAVLHVRPTYTKLHPLEQIPECFKAFLGLRAAFDWKCKTSEFVIKDAPKIQGPR